MTHAEHLRICSKSSVTSGDARRPTTMRSLCVLFLLGASGLAAQLALGPKDGRDLPPADLNRIQTGQPAPGFTLESASGGPVSLSDFRGKRVVLVFYRGQW